MLACCGLICDSCPIHLATLEIDRSRQIRLRESISEQYSSIYGMNIRPEDITDCDGCRAATGRLFSGCKTCEIRKCASLKQIENCAFCEDFACTGLRDFFRSAPEAEPALEKIRHTIGEI